MAATFPVQHLHAESSETWRYKVPETVTVAMDSMDCSPPRSVPPRCKRRQNGLAVEYFSQKEKRCCRFTLKTRLKILYTRHRASCSYFPRPNLPPCYCGGYHQSQTMSSFLSKPALAVCVVDSAPGIFRPSLWTGNR